MSARLPDATSAAQLAASLAGLLPTPEQVASDVWAIAAPIPAGQITHTLSYVLRATDGSLTLIDPGWDSDENLASLQSSLGTLGFTLQQVSSTISTHFHPDHLGIASRIRELVGAQVLFSGVEKNVLDHETSELENAKAAYSKTLADWGVPVSQRSMLEDSFDRPVLTGPVTPDRAVGGGDLIQIGGHSLLVIATPGHTSGHICLVDDRRRLIYTGDHVLPVIFSGIGIGSLPGSEPLSEYLDSLRILAPYDDHEVLPGHEYRFRGLVARSHDIATHHLRRTREVMNLSSRLGTAPIWDYAAAMTWTGGFASLSGFSLNSALRQTEMHLQLVRSGKGER